MLHAKAVLFDDCLAVIGSANMDMRSLFLNFEVALFVHSPKQVDHVASWAEALMADCKAANCPRPGGRVSLPRTSSGSCRPFCSDQTAPAAYTPASAGTGASGISNLSRADRILPAQR